MSEKHLKDEKYYMDLYDELTVKEGLRLERSHAEITKEMDPGASALYLELSMYFFKGERYAKKQDVVKEWMQKDFRRDQHFENAREPRNVACMLCHKPMEMFDKMFDYAFDKKTDRVCFYYRCPDCKVGKRIYDDGLEEDIIPWKCPSCSGEMDVTHQEKGEKLITIKKCKYCSYRDRDVLDWKSNPEPHPTAEEKKQFMKDKLRLCLSDKDGMEYVESRRKLDELSKMVEEGKEKREAQRKRGVVKVQSVTLTQLETLLGKAFKKSGFERFNLRVEDMAGDMKVAFTVQDMKERESYGSKRALKKVIDTTLKGTNWRLMSDGLTWKLGVLSGRLRGDETPSGDYVVMDDGRLVRM
ncbi:MAG: hypothetical protein ABII07_02280 [Patescibacteria group bacterium]